MAVSAAGPVLLAHQGGWDEILLIMGPIVVIMALLWLAKRRVDHAAALRDSSDATSGIRAGARPAGPDGRADAG